MPVSIPAVRVVNLVDWRYRIEYYWRTVDVLSFFSIRSADGSRSYYGRQPDGSSVILASFCFGEDKTFPIEYREFNGAKHTVKFKFQNETVSFFTPRTNSMFWEGGANIYPRRADGRIHGIVRQWSGSRLALLALNIGEMFHGLQRDPWGISWRWKTHSPAVSKLEYESLLPLADQFSCLVPMGVAKRIVMFT